MRNMLLITLLAGASSSAFSATINKDIALNVTATTIGHQFVPSASSTVDYIVGSDFGAVAKPSFSANLSQLNTFSITVSAPVGYEFLLRPASGSIGHLLDFGHPLLTWFSPGWNGGLRDYVPSTLSFTGFEGTQWYKDDTGVSIDQDGNGLIVEGGVWWLGASDVKFSSVTISADLSGLNGRNYLDGSFTSPGFAGNIVYQDVLVSGIKKDPGVRVSLVPAAVPLPPSILLFMSSLLLPLMSSFKKRSALRGSVV
ncbi:MAG: hypothetical protein ABL925_10795 [Methylococcales bacterium]